MATFAACAAMSNDQELRPRVATAVVRLALAVIAAGDTPPSHYDGDQRVQFNRRRAYALDVTTDVASFTTRAQWALSCWDQSTLADDYAAGGADAITDEALLETLRRFWVATAGS